MHHDSDGRFKLKIRHIILGVFAALLAAAILYLALLGSGANRRLEALRAAGQPTSLAELALRNKLPMGMENAAPIYESAFAAYVAPSEDVNVPYVSKQAKDPERGTRFSEPVAKVVTDYLAANEVCLARLHEAAGIATCRYDYDYRQGYPRLSDLRFCVLLLKLAAVYHANQGDGDAVVRCLEDTLRLGDSLEKEPMLIAYLVHIAGTAVAISGFQSVLSITSLTDSQLRDADAAFAETDGKIDLAQALVGERCYSIEYLRDPSLAGTAGPAAAILKSPGIKSRGIIDILDYMEDCIEAAGRPPVERLARFRQIEKRIQGLSFLHVAAKMLAPALSRVAELDLRTHAHLDMARTAVAIERYRLAEGRTPEQLADLVPKYLEQVPSDPFDGQPIRYRRAEPGYRLWSVMEDGKDNGGKEKEEVGKNEPYDLCFIVVK